ncbi:MAG TPA: putative Ig domain-containing protein [Myxococcaceae bacterium]|nr:putative Ig domain-containing protein [Myxococcaceae bacterium]
MSRSSAIVAAALVLGCVPQVYGSRAQRPFQEAPSGTRIALVSLEVPPWVMEGAPKGEDSAAQVKAGVLAAFKGGPYEVVDQLGAGFTIGIGPDSKPIIQYTASTGAEVGQQYLFDADGVANAVGVPPITWKVNKGPPGLTIDAETGRVGWVPPQKGSFDVELAAVNKHGETPYAFSVTVVDPRKEGKLPLGRPGNAVGPDQAFAASMPKGVPAAVDAPLLLGVQVVGWTLGSEPFGNISKPIAITDVVYSLWTREGREVETRRVRLEGASASSFQTRSWSPEKAHRRLTLIPPRDFWQRWDDAEGLVDSPPLDEKQLFPVTAQANGLAFSFPYTAHQIMFSLELDGSDAALKPGIELSNKKDYAGALQVFEQAAKANPNLAGAHYDMGAMCEVLGRDEDALQHYAEAVKLNPGEGMYQRALKPLQDRASQRKALLP